MNFPHTKSNKLDVIVKAQANCRYQRVPLTPDVITENDLSALIIYQFSRNLFDKYHFLVD